jgi:DNA-binding response OmpR family regulator
VTTGAAAEALAGVRVLVVEDDRSIGEQLVRGLTRAGCHVQLAGSVSAALRAHADSDVVLLDLGLPDGDGIELCERLRQVTAIPILVVTARDTERERVTALDAGADDYIAKPFGFAELLARIRAVLRRARRGDSAVVRYGPLSIDLAGQRVELDGEPLALTTKEFDILACLAAEPGRLVTREEIFDRAWDVNWYGPTKVLDVHIAAIRRKLGDASLIETVYGRGFRLRQP